MVAFFRTKGIRLVIYMDDLLVIAETKWLAIKQAREIKTHLLQLGFLISEKSMKTPSTTAPFLGVVIDSNAMTVSLPEGKIEAIHKLARALISKII